MRHLQRISAHVALIIVLANPAAAQDSSAVSSRVRLLGLTLDHWNGGAGSALLRPTLRFTTYAGRGPGAELALVFFPDGISISPPAVMFGLQAGLAQPLSAGPATVLLKAGGAGLAIAGLFGDGLFKLVPGVQAGAGLLLPVDSKTSIRLDVTHHLYRAQGYGHRVWSFGFGLTGGLRRRP